MSDDNEIEQARRRRIDEQRDAGDAFSFEVFRFDAEGGVGFLDEDDDHPICVLLNAEKLRGICMSPADALLLAEDLVGSARAWLFENELSPIAKERTRATRADQLFAAADLELNRLKGELAQKMMELEDAKRAVFDGKK